MKSVSNLGRALSLGLCAALLSVATVAQSGSVTTPLVGGNGQSGNMFDVHNLAAGALNILTLDQSFNNTNTVNALSIYTKSGTWVGSQTNAAAWTLVGSASATSPATLNVAVPIPLALNVTIPQGGIQAFFVIETGGQIVNYTTSTLLGSALAADANLQIDRGCGRSYGGVAAPFSGSVFGGAVVGGASRAWNGRVNYGPPPQPVWQVNQTNCTFTLNGTNGTVFTPATTNVTADNVCSFGSVNVVWSSALAGLPWDFAIAPGIVPSNAGGLVLNGPPVQLVNIDLTLPYPVLTFLNNLALNNAFPGGPIAFPFAPGAPTSAGGQLVVLDPGSFDSVALSQPCAYNCTFAAGGINVPLSDDGSMLYNLADPALCLSTGSFTFYGTTYTQIGVNMNGRLSFGTAVGNDWEPVITGTGAANGNLAADAGAPFVGAWGDFTVTNNANGNVNLSTPAAGIVQLAYINDSFFGFPTPQVSWSISLDQSTGNMAITGCSSFPVFTVGSPSNQMFLGISPGAAGGATDPGPTPFALGFVGGPGPTDMSYMYGQAGTLLTGVNTITFMSNGNGYDSVGS